MQFATVLCNICGTAPSGAEPRREKRVAGFGRQDVLYVATCERSTSHGHPLFLCLELLLDVVMYSSSGCHSSGWKSGFWKCAVLKCELGDVSTA